MGADAIEQSAEVQAARSGIGRARPDLELFRDGRIIAGHRCRFTAGRLALLQAADHPIFTGDDDDITDAHIISALYYLAERNLDASVWVADDEDARDKAYRKWGAGFSRRERVRVCDELITWFGIMRDSMPDGYDGDDHPAYDRHWCLTMVDLFGSEYSWDRDYTLWLLPFPTAVRLQDKIAVRRGIREEVGDVTDDAIALLEAAQKAKDNANG